MYYQGLDNTGNLINPIVFINQGDLLSLFKFLSTLSQAMLIAARNGFTPVLIIQLVVPQMKQ
jgi:hypothetical protein